MRLRSSESVLRRGVRPPSDKNYFFFLFFWTLPWRWNHFKKTHCSRLFQVDERIAALLLEKKFFPSDSLQKIIDFFAEVFVKYLYMKSNFSHLEIEVIIDILRNNYTLDNTQFAAEIRLVLQQQKQVQAPKPIPQVNVDFNIILVKIFSFSSLLLLLFLSQLFLIVSFIMVWRWLFTAQL